VLATSEQQLLQTSPRPGPSSARYASVSGGTERSLETEAGRQEYRSAARDSTSSRPRLHATGGPSSAGIVENQLRTVGPGFVEKQLSEAAQLLPAPDECEGAVGRAIEIRRK
jgi:hypothetical protein